MNPLQTAEQIKHLLSTVTWPGGSQDAVFGTRSVHVFAGTPTEEQIPAGFPWALVTFEPGEADEDHPEFIRQSFNILHACEVAGDPLGEFSIIGGSAADLGKSAGRGSAEVGARVRAAVADLTGIDGSKVIVSLTQPGAPTPVGRGRHIVVDEHTVEAWCLSQLHYAAPQEVVNTAGSLAWLGPHCSDRYDFVQYRVVEKAGSDPSTDPTDGTVVYTGSAAAAPGVASSGNTYTVFADYSSRGQSGVIEGSSEPERGSYIAVP